MRARGKGFCLHGSSNPNPLLLSPEDPNPNHGPRTMKKHLPRDYHSRRDRDDARAVALAALQFLYEKSHMSTEERKKYTRRNCQRRYVKHVRDPKKAAHVALRAMNVLDRELAARVVAAAADLVERRARLPREATERTKHVRVGSVELECRSAPGGGEVINSAEIKFKILSSAT